MITDGLARDLARYDREIEHADYEREQDDVIKETIDAVSAVFADGSKDRFFHLLAIRTAAQEIIDAVNYALDSRARK